MKERIERYTTAADHDLRCAELLEAGAILVSWVEGIGDDRVWFIKWSWILALDH